MKISSRNSWLFLLFFGLTVFPTPLRAFDLEGKVKLEAPLPKPVPLEIPEEQRASCGSPKFSSTLKISADGEVADAVVKLEGTFPHSKIPSPSRDYVLDQNQCEFSPHLLFVPEGATLSILNSDAMLHNVRAFNEKAEMLFNDAMPKKGQVLHKRFDSDEAGRIIVRCGVHQWMYAVVVVQDHPYYAQTDAKGHFKLSGIPEGNYTLSVWHEELGELRIPVQPKTSFLTVIYPANGKASNK